MSRHDPRIAAPAPHGNPGGATVGDLHAMDGEAALAVMMLRDWFEDAEGPARVASDLTEALGPAAGPAATEAWAGLMAGLRDHARRPVMRHALACRCLGADEAVVAQVLALAGRGAREDAMLVLALLIPGDRLLLVLRDAERAGQAVMRAAARWRREMPPGADPRRLH